MTPFQSAPATAPAPSRPADPRIDTGTAAIGRSEVERIVAALKAREGAGPAPGGASAPSSGRHPPTVALPNASFGAPSPPTVMLPDTPATPAIMPLERYAQISALLSQENDPPATFRRLGIDVVAWMGTVRAYAQRFREDPALERSFDQLVDRALGRRT